MLWLYYLVAVVELVRGDAIGTGVVLLALYTHSSLHQYITPVYIQLQDKNLTILLDVRSFTCYTAV